LWGRGGAILREQLLEARSAGERLRLLEASLLRKLQHARAGHPATRAAIAAFAGDVRVAEVANMVGLSHRGFVHVFEREVGLTPKLYARLQRFHRAKEQMAIHGAPRSWASFAIDCGYFDQSHMIRDFVGFSGISPTGYLQRRDDETMFDNRVHGDRLAGIARHASRSA
jgi:AraC-like DNA-binding protein